MKFVGQVSEKKDLANVQYIDDKTSVFTTSVSDDFLNQDKIDSANTTTTYTLGKVRAAYPAKFYEDFNTKNNFDNTVSNTNVDIENGVLKLKNGKTGTFISEPITLENAVSGVNAIINYKQNSPDNLVPAGAVCLGEESQITTENAVLSAVHVTDSGKRWYFYTTSTALKTYCLNSNGTVFLSQTSLNTYTSYTYTYSSTNVKNISVCSGGADIYVLFPITNTNLRIIKFAESESPSVSSSDVYVQTTYTIQNTSMVFENNHIHIAYSLYNTANVNRVVQYQKVNTSLTSIIAATSIHLVSAPTAVSTDGYIGCELVKSENNKIAVVGFYRSTTLGRVSFAVIDASQTALNYTVSAQSTTQTEHAGQGVAVWDSVRILYRIISYQNRTTVRCFSNSNVGGFTGTDTLTLSDDYGAGTGLQISSAKGFFDSVNEKVHLYYIVGFDSTTFDNFFSRINFQGGVSLISTVDIASGVNSARCFMSIAKLSTSTNSTVRYVVSHNVLNQPIYSQVYDYISPTISFDIRNSTTFSSSVRSGGAVTLSISGTNIASTLTSTQSSFRVAFSFNFPTVETVNGSVEVESYTIEQTAPAITPSEQTSVFYTTPIVTDRIVNEVTLDVSQTVPSISGNSIIWQVSSLGDNWQSVTLVNGVATVQITNPGSNLRLRAYLTRGATVDSIENLPYIDSYNVTVRNVLIANDLLPLQVNIMKLGLQVGTWNASQRTGFNNMMIDLFNNTDGVTTSGVSYDSTLKHFSGTGTVTSNQESTDNNVFPTRIIIVSDASASGITYRAKRTNGSWESVTPDTVYTFTTGSSGVSNIIQIEATLSGQTLYGFAYLYA